MKKTLGELLNPRWNSYRSIGELAKTLQHLLQHSNDFRYQGRWGSCGPTEDIVGYSGCVNCDDHSWHSHRIVGSCISQKGLTTWQQNHDALYDCILTAVCSDDTTSVAWRKAHRISLDMVLKFSMAYQSQEREQEAWKQFESLNGYKLPEVKTLNTCHRGVNLLCYPELIVGKEGIVIECDATMRSEFRSSGIGSSWSVCFLLHGYSASDMRPRWRSQRETFADFMLRAVHYYKSVRQTFRK